MSITGTVPIIRSPKGNAAEMVAKKLDKKLRENLFDARNNLFSTDTQRGQFNFHRPLLIILDRNVDMATPLHHTWTYQALAHDVLNLSLNRVVIEDSTVQGGNNCFVLFLFILQLNFKEHVQNKRSVNWTQKTNFGPVTRDPHFQMWLRQSRRSWISTGPLRRR